MRLVLLGTVGCLEYAPNLLAPRETSWTYIVENWLVTQRPG